MTDLKLTLTQSGGDLAVLNGDLELDQGLETAAVVSVLTDARTGANPNVSELEQNLRGAWFDRPQDRWGSLLWTLERAKRLPQTAETARASVVASLAWMLEDEIASAVEAQASFGPTGELDLAVQIQRGAGRRYDSLWAGTGQVQVAIGPLSQAPPIVVPPAPKKNILYIPLDDGGAEVVNWSGLPAPAHGYALTPNLDFLRTLGVTFTRAFANPICGPTRARVRTNRYAFHSSLGGNLDGAGSLGYQLGIHGGVQTETMLGQAVRLGLDGTDDMHLGLTNFVYAIAWFGKLHLCADSGQELWPINVDRVGRYVGCQPNAGSMENWAPGTLGPLGVGDPGYIAVPANSGHFHYRETSANFGQSAPGYTSTTYGAPGIWPAGGPYVAWNPAATVDGAGNPIAPTKCAWDAYKNFRDFILWANSRTQAWMATLCFNPPHAPFEVPPYTIPDTVGFGATGLDINLISPATQAAMTALDGGGKGPGYAPPQTAYPDASTIAVFKANIEAIDTLIGLIRQRLDPAMWANTIVMFFGDNGTVAQAVDAPYFADEAKRSPYYMGAAVPMIVFGGAGTIASPGRTTDHLTHVVDVFATIMDLVGADPLLWNPTNRVMDGRSFAPLLADPAALPHRTEIYNDLFVPLDASLDPPPGAPPIDPHQWVKSCFDGTYHIIVKPTGVSPPYEFYKAVVAVQPASGLSGVIEAPADNLYPFVIDGAHHQITNAFNTLLTRVNEILAT